MESTSELEINPVVVENCVTNEMNLKTYYEKFKDELSDNDFSDCEMVETNSCTEIEFVEVETREPSNYGSITKKENVGANQGGKKSSNKMFPRNKQPSEEITITKVPTKKLPFKPNIKLKPIIEFQCERCQKIFSKKKHVDDHLVEHCDRQLTFAQRRRNIKKEQ